MKKLMIMAAVALAAAVSQAATVTWKSYNPGTSKNTFLVNDDGAQIGAGDFASMGVNFVLVALTGDDLTAYNAGELNLAYDADKVLSTGKISGSTKAAGKGSFSTDFTFAYADGKIADGNVLAVLITDGQSMQNITYFSGDKVTDSLTVSGLSTDQDLYSKTLNFATAGNFTAQIESVPEPTSAMLLMLGLAGLALRRRRA